MLANAWDIGSAWLLCGEGLPALATTSAGIAFSRGLPDRGEVPRDLVLAVAGGIAAAVDVPVSADLEDGYGADPEAVGRTIGLAVEAGLVGCNLEDGTGDAARPLRDSQEMVERLRAARAAADAGGRRFFINARTDGYWVGGSGPETLREAVRRGQAYLEAGADGIFVPLVVQPDEIAVLVRELDGPLNVLVSPRTPSVPRLMELGVRRLSAGGGLLRAAYGAAREAVRELLGPGTYGFAERAIPHAEMERLMTARVAGGQ